MNPTTQKDFKGISKIELYKALTGFARSQSSGENRFSGHPISLDVSVEAEMDNALILVKKMERKYSGNNPLAGYYQSQFQKIDEAYRIGKPEQFKEALKSLTDSIYRD